MGKIKDFWKSAWDQFAAPKVSDEELERCFQQARRELPLPVFWLLGKAQSGKTSLIRTLTGNTRAEIGNGIRPCTRTAHEYPFPSDEDCLLRFLDTRGLGEVQYDPSEDIALFQDQAHLIIVVMKAMDHAQTQVLDALETIHGKRSQWPVLVVQTSLHEAYANRDEQHILPYPYGETPFPPQVAQDLARSLQTQRLMCAERGIMPRFVAVDFTLAEDGFEPADYGIDALWQAIEELLPLGLRGMIEQHEEVQRDLRDVHLRAALPHVWSYAVAAGAAAAVPLPLVDLPLVLAVQTKMFHSLASIYHQEFDRKTIGEVLGTLGISYLGRLGGRELLKVIPGYGSAIAALYSGASTYALGRTLCVYFARVRDGNLPDSHEFQRLYDIYFMEGSERLHAYLERLHKPRQEPP